MRPSARPSATGSPRPGVGRCGNRTRQRTRLDPLGRAVILVDPTADAEPTEQTAATGGRPNSRVTRGHLGHSSGIRAFLSSSKRPYGFTCSHISGVSALRGSDSRVAGKAKASPATRLSDALGPLSAEPERSHHKAFMKHAPAFRCRFPFGLRCGSYSRP